MATYAYEDARMQEVYVRRVLAGGNEKYIRLHFVLVDYNDGNGTFCEPIQALGLSGMNLTFDDLYTIANDAAMLIVDRPPYSETMNF